MRKTSKSFCEVDFLLFHIKGNQQNLYKNALAKFLRNACEKIVYNKSQVYSLQM